MVRLFESLRDDHQRRDKVASMKGWLRISAHMALVYAATPQPPTSHEVTGGLGGVLDQVTATLESRDADTLERMTAEGSK